LLLTLAAGLRPSPLTSLLLLEVGVVLLTMAVAVEQVGTKNLLLRRLLLELLLQSRLVLEERHPHSLLAIMALILFFLQPHQLVVAVEATLEIMVWLVVPVAVGVVLLQLLAVMEQLAKETMVAVV
jgi:hypothetical protein